MENRYPQRGGSRGVHPMKRPTATQPGASRHGATRGEASGLDAASVETGSSTEREVGTTTRPTTRLTARPVPVDEDADVEDEEEVPNAERLVADAVAYAAATHPDEPQLVELVADYWRLVPDEELVCCTPAAMVE